MVLSEKERTSAERERLKVLTFVLIENEIPELICASHQVCYLDVYAVKRCFSYLIDRLEHVSRRPRFIAVGIFYEIAGTLVVFLDISVFTDKSFFVGLSVGHGSSHNLFSTDVLFHVVTGGFY
jgi:hypothetical protein